MTWHTLGEAILGTVVLVFAFTALAAVLTNIVANHLQQAFHHHPSLRRPSRGRGLALFGGVVLALQAPAFVLENRVAVRTELDRTVATSTRWTGYSLCGSAPSQRISAGATWAREATPMQVRAIVTTSPLV